LASCGHVEKEQAVDILASACLKVSYSQTDLDKAYISDSGAKHTFRLWVLGPSIISGFGAKQTFRC